jgi:hypothetical protein
MTRGAAVPPPCDHYPAIIFIFWVMLHAFFADLNNGEGTSIVNLLVPETYRRAGQKEHLHYINYLYDTSAEEADTMKTNSPGVIFTILTLCLLFLNVSGSFGADPAALAPGMDLLKAETAKLGPAKIEGSALYFGSTKMNGNYEIVDKIKAQFDITATLFVKKDDGFLRISTNVVKDDGNRAVGTVLDPNGQAIVAIRKGERFAGKVDILGKPYDTIYEPVRNEAGEIIGVYYVGLMVK